jgi:hypothetical protein
VQKNRSYIGRVLVTPHFQQDPGRISPAIPLAGGSTEGAGAGLSGGGGGDDDGEGADSNSMPPGAARDAAGWIRRKRRRGRRGTSEDDDEGRPAGGRIPAARPGGVAGAKRAPEGVGGGGRS